MAAAYRVPVLTGPVVELNVILDKSTNVEEINRAFLKASQESMKGILTYSTDPIVSTDIISNTSSCVFDSLLTSVNEGMVHIVGWYDNEAGYSRRLAELASKITT